MKMRWLRALPVWIILYSPVYAENNKPIQAWLFDGAYNSASLYGVAFTDAGLVGHTHWSLGCPDGEIGGGQLALSPATAGVFAEFGTAPRFGPLLNPYFFFQWPPSIDPALVEDDCHALDNLAAVQDYVDDLNQYIVSRASMLDTCLEDVYQLACDVLAVHEEASAMCAANHDLPGCTSIVLPSCPSFSSSMPGVGSPGYWTLPCLRCQETLEELFDVAEYAEKALAGCHHARDWLAQNLNDFQAFIDGQAWYPFALGFCLDEELAARVEEAENAASWLEDVFSSYDYENLSQAEECSLAALQPSCEDCPDDGQTGLEGDPPVLVNVTNSRKQVKRLWRAFKRAARLDTDPVLQESYLAMAQRLKTLPRERVLDVTVPVDLPFSQSFVALRLPQQVTDPASPLAVVLTFEQSEPADAQLNRADFELLMQALASFKGTLARPIDDLPQ
jgi:hypothetical protein